MLSDSDALDAIDIDPLLPSSTVCAALGGIRPETLCRRVGRGEFPKPDRVVNRRNYWLRSTVRRETQGKTEAA